MAEPSPAPPARNACRMVTERQHVVNRKCRSSGYGVLSRWTLNENGAIPCRAGATATSIDRSLSTTAHTCTHAALKSCQSAHDDQWAGWHTATRISRLSSVPRPTGTEAYCVYGRYGSGCFVRDGIEAYPG